MEIRKIENIMRLMSNYQIDELEISDNQQKILTVTTPFHIKKGDVIKIDTRNSLYVEKIK